MTFDEPNVQFPQGTSTHGLGSPSPATVRKSDDERCASVVGSGPFVPATLARVTGADELLVTTITTEHADRVRSTELPAAAWAEHADAPVGCTAQNRAEASVRR